MRLTSLIFRDTLKVNADYGTIVTSFKSRLNKNFYKGYIDREGAQLFYFSGFLKRPLSVDLPVVQLNFKNKKDDRGQTTIKFKIVNVALILFVLANGFIALFSIVNLDPYRPNPPIPQVVPLLLFPVSYGFLLFMYLTELSEFKREIKRLQ